MITLFVIHCSLFVSNTAAQTFTQRLQKSAKGEGTVTIHQDASIDRLVNGPQPVVVTPKQKQTITTPKQTTQPKKKKKVERPDNENKPETEQRQGPEESVNQTPETTTSESQSVDTTTVTKIRTYKTMGYRVQAYAGGNSRKDRQKAEQTGNQLRSLFPEEQVYTQFYSPRWICRIGNYRTYEEAHRMLQEVKKLGYTSATIVKGKISVPY